MKCFSPCLPVKLARVAGLAVGLLLLLVNTSVAAPSWLDPCGMVPPIYTGPGSPIVRTGLQQTYVFYKDGVETFVIRPGFQGKVDNFGMLIPFPNPPALRKVPDDIFQQIANAVDPPEVVVDQTMLRSRWRRPTKLPKQRRTPSGSWRE